ncbi:hypothetical protein FPOAC1_006760 [Fusarium poae]|uniref:hypothetical protein n=1 Tax=Fusarium poae TaxID=36050 RepID=UPI001CE9C3F7|nr:hypothetical protein FPOAC1_006760 [Fusarium poae]KAG8673448.1 hypothetical protein FPOAC1_006760 [Fusarium poae]
MIYSNLGRLEICKRHRPRIMVQPSNSYSPRVCTGDKHQEPPVRLRKFLLASTTLRRPTRQTIYAQASDCGVAKYQESNTYYCDEEKLLILATALRRTPQSEPRPQAYVRD